MSFHRNGEKSLVIQKKELKEEMLFALKGKSGEGPGSD